MTAAHEVDQPNALLAALRYASIGLRVLPIRPKTKQPMLVDWPTRASTDPDTIRGWWARAPQAGVGLVMGRQPDGTILVAVDIDAHNPHQPGADTIRDLEETYGPLPDTWTAVTGGGGAHQVYRVPRQVGNDAGRLLGPGVDIRGDGGQIVVEPTLHPDTGRAYCWEDGAAPWDIDVAEAPGWLIALLEADQRTPPAEPPSTPYDGAERPGDRWAAATPWAELLSADGAAHLATTRAGIQLWARPGLETPHTSATVGAVANCLHVFTTGWPGLQPGNYTKIGYLAATQHGGDFNAASRWLVTQGYGTPHEHDNGNGPPGPGLTEEPAPNRIRANFYMGPAIWDLPAVEWLIDETIQTDGLTVIYGAPKSFKTFVALDMAMHLANGRNWRGIPTKPTTVLYVVAEGAPGVGPRAKAWCNRHGGTIDRVGWIVVAPNLFAVDGDTWHVGELAAEIGAGLVIVDTLARAMPGGDENSAKDIGYLVANFDSIREQAGCALLAVHHTGKDAARGMRGSSSLQGAVDTSLEVVGDAHAVNVRVADQKNAESDRAWWFKPTRETPSLVLEPTDGTGSSDGTRDANILRQLVLMDSGSGVGVSAWAAAVADRGICGDTTFYERLKAMKDGGLIDNRGTDKRRRWSLTAAGTASQQDAVDGRRTQPQACG